MLKRTSLLTAFALCSSPLRGEPVPAASYLRDRPKLLVVLVIDQFRADLLTKFSDRLLPAVGSGGKVGGLQYLMTKGATFFHGQYDNLQNMTGPGHATILTGAHPYQTGIATNYWYNAATTEPVYCTEDASMPTVGIASAKAHVGTSPRNLLATTVGDELKNAGYQSRVVSISLKDRAAILMGGHRADLALWIDQPSMQWVSSKFYLPDGKLPAWVAQTNSDLKKYAGLDYTWDKKGAGSGLEVGAVKPKLSSTTGATFGAAFPHTIISGTAATLASPIGLEMTVDLAEKAVKEFALGKHKGTDVLAVSFSSHDYVGHAFGPNSREIEEMTIAEDKNIARLLNNLAATVPGGLKNMLIVLTADHGIPPNPDWLKTQRIDAGRIDQAKLTTAVEAHLVSRFGTAPQNAWVLNVTDLNFYLNKSAAAAKNIPLADLEAATKEYLLANEPGLMQVFTHADYRARRLPPGLIEQQILRTYVPGRSGDVVGVLKPFYMTSEYGVEHMTGHSYDRTVPIVLAGAHVRPGFYPDAAKVVDIAPTLSFLLGVIPPSLSEGRVLAEAIAP